jgi:hypothetical protein
MSSYRGCVEVEIMSKVNIVEIFQGPEYVGKNVCVHCNFRLHVCVELHPEISKCKAFENPPSLVPLLSERVFSLMFSAAWCRP